MKDTPALAEFNASIKKYSLTNVKEVEPSEQHMYMYRRERD